MRKIIGWLLLIGLILLVVKWLLITAALLAVPFGAWWLWDRHRRSAAQRRADAAAARRREIESRAVVDPFGGCGWCGSRLPHRDDAGRPASPAAYHRGEIEQAVLAAAP